MTELHNGASKGGARDDFPLRAQILSISCSFWEILAKSYVGVPPPPGELAPPPRGNPGSATVASLLCMSYSVQLTENVLSALVQNTIDRAITTTNPCTRFNSPETSKGKKIQFLASFAGKKVSDWLTGFAHAH